tara:strand:+ start:605 stop:805 length:201 start_codon:yes stop_codon:yes gene_type:complete
VLKEKQLFEYIRDKTCDIAIAYDGGLKIKDLSDVPNFKFFDMAMQLDAILLSVKITPLGKLEVPEV